MSPKDNSQQSPNSTDSIQASSEKLFETLMQQTADWVYMKDSQGRFIAASQSLAEMHGFESADKLKGLTDFDLFSKEEAEQAYYDEQQVLKNDKAIISKLEKKVWPDGSQNWVSSTKAPLHLEDGSAVGIIGISRDVTTEFNAQKQLAESEHQLRLQNATMRSDFESAREVQSIMIPGRIPQLEDVEIAHIWKPMNAVGGDIINFPRNPNNKLLFFMGDVCGHGIKAAFSTVLLKYLTAHEAESYDESPTNLLDAINHEATGRIQGFVTGICGHFDPKAEDESRTLHLAHSGHPLNVIHRAKTGAIETAILATGMVMGIPGGQASDALSVKLEKGDRFYTFTDGIIESANPEGVEFGRKKIDDCFRETAHLSLKEAMNYVYREVIQFTKISEQQDDITLLGFELK